MNRYLSRAASQQVLQKIQQLSLPWVYDYDKHRLILQDEKRNDLIYLRLPIVIPPPEQNLSPPLEKINYLIILIQSGSCALGNFEDGLNLDHKVFKSYMVRMKQGKSQVKYLKTKGKSRAGSRVRLAETVEFFENINERIQEYFNQATLQRICLSCSKILIPYLFQSKVPPPFDKKDERIFHIPRHIHTPNYEILLDTNKFLLKGELIYEPQHQPLIQLLVNDEPG